MKHLLPFLLVISLASCSKKQTEWKDLWNGKDLTGWDTYLGPTFDTVSNAMDTTLIPGLNNSAQQVFQVVTIDGQPALRISGEQFGGISTKEEFKNYHLRLQFKWGQATFAPKKGKKRDSGLLYHAVGPHGADYGFWMRSQEFQIQEGDCGDYWGVAGGVMEIPATGSEVEKYVYNPKAPLLAFSGSSKNGRRCIKNTDAEKPTGEWNELELYCLGDTAMHVMNGKKVMMLYHSQQDDHGKLTPLIFGKIQLQSEGAELYFRAIQIQPITALPSME
jgi:hypothetical protein